MDSNKIIYSLNVEDVQEVAIDELDRELNDEEISILEREIHYYIDWYMAITNVINERFQ